MGAGISVLPGLAILEFGLHQDERGSFHKVLGVEALLARGIDFEVQQAAISKNTVKGTLRGMHYQDAPFQEQKLVRCVRGRVFDVAVDVRSQSPNFGKWFGLELSEANGRSLYIPGGFAHGFVTLEDDSDIAYLISGKYSVESSRVLNWRDPAFGIAWPVAPVVMSQRDSDAPFLNVGDRP